MVLNNTAGSYVLEKSSRKSKLKQAAVQDTVSHQGNWSVDITLFTIDSTGFQYDDDNKQAAKSGMDLTICRSVI